MEGFEKEEKLAELEALLFVHGEPIRCDKIGKTLGLKEGEVETLLGELEKRLSETHHGLTVFLNGGRAQLITKPGFGRLLENFVKEELREELTPASLETLSIIAYCAPISRSRIEYLRGVNSSFILRNLMIRGLIDRSPDPQEPQVFLYEPTSELMKYLGLKRKGDLPDYEKFQALLKNIEAIPESS